MQTARASFSKHAMERGTEREIPPGIVDYILDYGEVHAARDGACKFALSKRSLREIRHYAGRPMAKVMSTYRKAYVVVAGGHVITVAWAKSPLVR